VDQSSPFERVAGDAELVEVEGGLGIGLGDRVVIVGCTPPFPPLKPGQIPWNPWIGAPYPMPF
jgi:hypothetical protein